MDPITIAMLIISVGSTGLTLGKKNQANLKAQRDGEAAVAAGKKLADAQLLALDALYLADMRTATATAQATKVEADKKAAQLTTLLWVTTLMTFGLVALIGLRSYLNTRVSPQ